MLEQLMDLDSGFLMYIQEFVRNDAATRIFRGITTLGNAGAVWIVISLLLLVPKKTRRIGCMGLLSLVLSLLFNNMLLKHLIARSRPYDCILGLIPLITPPTDYSSVPEIAEAIWNPGTCACCADRIFQIVSGGSLSE